MGGEGGDLGGEGGESGGGGGTLTLEEACTARCQNRTHLACDRYCVEDCVYYGEHSWAPGHFLVLVQCEARELGPEDYECYDEPTFGPPDFAGVSANTPCEEALCAFTCADQTFVIENIFIRCGC
jgi:hypothetical protein